MPKPHTFPILYDEVLKLSFSKLKDLGYFKPESVKSGILTWSRNGNKTGSISINVVFLIEEPYIELDYKFKGEPRNYKIQLVSLPSNLGKGLIWYFLCPQTNKRCRKLYSVGGYFLHREAFNGCMYESQVQSKLYRQLEKTFGSYVRIDDLYAQLDKKHFKRFYAGKPTKRYMRLKSKLEHANSVSYDDFKSAMFKPNNP